MQGALTPSNISLLVAWTFRFCSTNRKNFSFFKLWIQKREIFHFVLFGKLITRSTRLLYVHELYSPSWIINDLIRAEHLLTAPCGARLSLFNFINLSSVYTSQKQTIPRLFISQPHSIIKRLLWHQRGKNCWARPESCDRILIEINHNTCWWKSSHILRNKFMNKFGSILAQQSLIADFPGGANTCRCHLSFDLLTLGRLK